jgi:hypothetical protein
LGLLVVWIRRGCSWFAFCMLFCGVPPALSLTRCSKKMIQEVFFQCMLFCFDEPRSAVSYVSGWLNIYFSTSILGYFDVVRQETSRATSRHSFITTVWWCNILYQTPWIR